MAICRGPEARSGSASGLAALTLPLLSPGAGDYLTLARGTMPMPRFTRVGFCFQLVWPRTVSLT